MHFNLRVNFRTAALSWGDILQERITMWNLDTQTVTYVMLALRMENREEKLLSAFKFDHFLQCKKLHKVRSKTTEGMIPKQRQKGGALSTYLYLFQCFQKCSHKILENQLITIPKDWIPNAGISQDISGTFCRRLGVLFVKMATGRLASWKYCACVLAGSYLICISNTHRSCKFSAGCFKEVRIYLAMTWMRWTWSL